MKDSVFPRGMRPVAMEAVSERERAKGRPHRHQSGRNLMRALMAQAAAPELAGETACPTTEPKKKGRKRA